MELAVIKGIKNVSDLAIYMGYDSAEKLYRLKRKPRAKPSYDIVEDFTNKFEDLNVRWFVTGYGKPLVDNKIHAITHHVQHAIAEPAGSYNEEPPTTKLPDKTIRELKPPRQLLSPQIITVDKLGNKNILLINVKAAAGYLNGFADREYLENLPSFSLPGLTDAAYRAFEVDGDSMFPTLENKEMIIGQWVGQLDYIREDRVHIVVTKTQGIIIKRLLNRVEKYGYIIAKSDAADNRNTYPNMEIHPNEIVEIWYAVWHGSFNFKSPTEMYKRVNNLEADLTEVLRVLKEKNLMA